MPESRGAASVTLDTIIAPILSEWLDFADEDDEGKEFAQAVASSITDALLAQFIPIPLEDVVSADFPAEWRADPRIMTIVTEHANGEHTTIQLNCPLCFKLNSSDQGPFWNDSPCNFRPAKGVKS